MGTRGGSAPAFRIGAEQRAADGRLRPEDLARVVAVLQADGFAVLPSDTAFSVAVLPRRASLIERVNTMLRRKDMPVSLAFPDVAATRRWRVADPVADALLDRFCPGPITVVCAASPLIPSDLLLSTVASRNHTVGVRIPGSAVERQVAGATRYPVTTIAVRDAEVTSTPVVVDLAAALDLIGPCAGEAGFDTWCAIDGTVDVDTHSTVVEVVDGDVVELRPGAIPTAEIMRAAAAARHADSSTEPTTNGSTDG